MIVIKEVLSRRQRRDFLEFPNRLYKGNPCYVPPLYIDEKKIFDKDYLYYDTCEAVYYNAYVVSDDNAAPHDATPHDAKMAGRISGIIQRASNEKTGQKRVRFTRFDCIEDINVAKALFEAVESWARAKGMEIVCGPLGFSDLEREGMLIEGFDELSTFEEQYNAPYYPEFVERLGYRKEVDWYESRIYAPDPEQEAELWKMSEFIMRRYGLRFGPARNAKDFLRKYMDGFFDILDKSYEGIYGTVPFTEGMKKLLVANFNLIIDTKHVAVILDKDDNVILMAICFPGIARAMQLGGGHLTPRAILKFLQLRRRPQVIDLGLIGVDPAWANRGISVCVAAELAKMLRQKGTLYAETNLNLEDNYAILNLWKRFNSVQHKKRRAYIKML